MSGEEKWSKFFYQSNICALAASTGVLYNITQRTEPLSNALNWSLTLACLALPILILCIYRWLINEYQNDPKLETLHSLSNFIAILSVICLVYHHSALATATLLFSTVAAVFLTKQNKIHNESQPEA